MGISIPTKARCMSDDEYKIVSRVFGKTLPDRSLIIVTNGAGLGGRAFTIPVSLLSTLLGGTTAIAITKIITALIGSNVVNDGFIINVGGNYNNLVYPEAGLLVHETAHVWQGTNSTFALSYVFSSCLNQCVFGSAAYTYSTGRAWTSYNPEQQASIIMDWFLELEPTSGNKWEYIDKYVRKGIT